MKMKMIRVSDTLNILKKLGKIEEKIDSKFYYSLDSFGVKTEGCLCPREQLSFASLLSPYNVLFDY